MQAKETEEQSDATFILSLQATKHILVGMKSGAYKLIYHVSFLLAQWWQA